MSSTTAQRRAAAFASVADYAVFLAIFAFVSLHWLTGFKALPWDAMDEFYPVSRFVTQSLAEGHWPWWNPYQYSGTPLFADPQSLIFSLYTPVGVALGPHYTPTVFGCLTMLHLAAGGVALIAYARHFQASMLQRVMAALLFATAGVATSRLQHVPQIVTYCYWPVALYVGYLWVTQRQAWHLLALTGVLALIAVNPNQLTLLGAVAIGALLLVHVTQCAASCGWALGGLLLAAGSALAMASPVLAAVLEFSQLSTRTAHTLLDSQASSLPISALSGLFFPGVFGIGGWGRLLWMANDISENWLYLGVGSVFVLLLGLRDRPTHAAVAILLLLVLAAAFVLGVNTPFYPWLYAHVPGFSLFRRPSDGAYAIIFLASLLLLHQRSIQLPGPRRLWMLAALAVGGAALFVWVSGAARWADSRAASPDFFVNSVLAIARFAAVVLMLAWVSRRAPAGWADRPTAVAAIAFLLAVEACAPARFREFLGNSRSWAAGQIYRGTPTTAEARELEQLIGALRGLGVGGPTGGYRFESSVPPLGLAMPSAVQLNNTQGYSPIRVDEYHRVVGAPEPWIPRTFSLTAPSYASPWFRALGVGYVVVASADNKNQDRRPAFIEAARGQRRDLEAQAQRTDFSLAGYEIWALPTPNPPVALVAAERLRQTEPAAHEPQLGRCDLLDRNGDSVLARCRVESDAVVIFSEIAYPGWHACVDAAPVPMMTAWGLLRAVPITPGEHSISLRFQPVPFLRWQSCQ